VERFRKRFGEIPEAYAVYGYEAACVALQAIRVAGRKDRRAITDAALAIRDFDGALGHWSFDANGDTTMRTLTVSGVRDGHFAFEEILDASTEGGGVGGEPPGGESADGAAAAEAAR
jgi:branched-chain amino acid transport system substrate-binding protein